MDPRDIKTGLDLARQRKERIARLKQDREAIMEQKLAEAQASRFAYFEVENRYAREVTLTISWLEEESARQSQS
jgi:hypothetical protein